LTFSSRLYSADNLEPPPFALSVESGFKRLRLEIITYIAFVLFSLKINNTIG